MERSDIRRALLAALLCLAACKTDHDYVLVRVHDIPVAATALTATFTLDGTQAMEPAHFDAPAGGFKTVSTFAVALPDKSTGELVVDVQALDGAGCTIAAATNSVQLPAPELDVTLAAIGPDCPPPADAGFPDAGVCPDCVNPPRLRFPWNGYATGSAHAPSGDDLPSTLRPIFRWERVDNAASYHLQLDDSCPTPGFDTCPFPSPELDTTVPGTAASFRLTGDLLVFLTPPVGRRYYWRLQVCDRDGACSPWSPVRYLDVGRLPDDFNGDGYSDAIIGAYGNSPAGLSGSGAAWVLYGGPELAGLTPLSDPSPQAGAYFGYGLAAVGDVNGDGFGDAVVGAFQADDATTDQGRAYLFLGTVAGLTAGAPLALPVGHTSAAFGYRSAGGDLNGDGFADVVVAAPFYDDGTTGETDEGYLFVFYGAAVFPGAPTPLDNPEASQLNGYMGFAVASGGDLDGDGYVDLAAGAVGGNKGAAAQGLTYVWRGGPGGVAAAPDWTLAPDNQASEAFGSSAAFGDVNGDGFADLVAGAHAYDGAFQDQGRAYVWYGARQGIADGTTADLAIESSCMQSSAYFGDELTIARDLEGDGFSDLIIGAWDCTGDVAGEGITTLYGGSPAGLGAPRMGLDNPSNQASSRFGLGIAAGDLNGDGYSDLLIGTPWEDGAAVDQGRVDVYLGSPVGIAATPSMHYENPAVMSGTGGVFGASIAWLQSADCPGRP